MFQSKVLEPVNMQYRLEEKPSIHFFSASVLNPFTKLCINTFKKSTKRFH